MNSNYHWMPFALSIVMLTAACSTEATSPLSVQKNTADTAYALSGVPSSAAPGDTIQVAWTAPSDHSPKDWIGLYQVGSPNTAFKSYAYVGAAFSGTVTLRLPSTATGSWEFRYFANNLYDLKTTSAPFVAQAGYALTGAPTTAAPGGAVQVTFTSPANHSTRDWVGLYQVGAANSAFATFAYVPAGATGNMSLTLPKSATGNWEFRYFVNNTYERKASSASFAVQQASTSYALTSTQSNALPGGTVSVTWTAPITHAANDWIGLYQVGSPNTAFKAFAYVPAGASGTMSLKLPSTATGDWQFRYLIHGGYESKATSAAIKVTSVTTIELRHANICTDVAPMILWANDTTAINFGLMSQPLTLRSIAYDLYEGVFDGFNCLSAIEHSVKILAESRATPSATPTVLAEFKVPSATPPVKGSYRTVSLNIPTPVHVPANSHLFIAITMPNQDVYGRNICPRLCDLSSPLSHDDFWTPNPSSPYAWASFASLIVRGRTYMSVTGVR